MIKIIERTRKPTLEITNNVLLIFSLLCLSTLNKIHPLVSFTIPELEDDGKLPFLGMVFNGPPRLDTKVYTDTGFLLYHQSHVDVKYQHSLIKTIKCYIGRANSLRMVNISIRNVIVLKGFQLSCVENTIRHFIETTRNQQTR